MGKVTDIFRSVAPAILWLTLSSGDMLGLTPGHEIWSQPDGWVYAAELTIGDSLLSIDGEPVEIVDIYLDPTPTAVYNFEVDGTFTYFAERAWVHNNSCRIRNSHLAGKRHPKTGVPFDNDGFPDFSDWVIREERIVPTGNPKADIAAANELFQAPPGYTWHHHQDVGRMQLVPYEIHKQTGHTGGASIWGGGY